MPARSPTPLVSASDLKRQRAWTEGLIDGLLGAPDALAPNPHGFRPPMRYFAFDRVLEAERAPAFLSRAEKLDERRRWRREQPTRVRLSTDVERLEWLQDPRRIALFVVPRVPRRRRARASRPEPVSEPARYALGRFEVLRLF